VISGTREGAQKTGIMHENKEMIQRKSTTEKMAR